MENNTFRVRVFPTNGDELALQNAADHHGVRVQFGGISGVALSSRTLGLNFERIDAEGHHAHPTEWFVAYLECRTFQDLVAVYTTFQELLGVVVGDRAFDVLREWLSSQG